MNWKAANSQEEGQMRTKRFTVVTFAVAAFLVAMCFWPTGPKFEALTSERATVRSIASPPASTIATFQTSSGAEVICTRVRSGGCPIEQLQKLRSLQRELVVWHDGSRVYQIADNGRILYPYDDLFRGRGLLLTIAFLIAMAGVLQVAVHAGLVNRYDESGKLR
ncbi:MAG: hypothetical protein EON49_25370 [Acidovorax sp.]|nr:MAG: hypothetical protein EON49_25370 [Acidovorax sp.]